MWGMKWGRCKCWDGCVKWFIQPGRKGQLCMGGLLHHDGSLLGDPQSVLLESWWDFYKLEIATAISEQASTDSGSTGLQLRAIFPPEARRLPGSEKVPQMVPQVSVRWGSSMRPCHLAFPRSHLPEPLYIVSQGSGVWLPALLLEFALTMQLVCPAPWRMRNHRQQKPLEVTPNRASGLGSPLCLSSFLLPL